MTELTGLASLIFSIMAVGFATYGISLVVTGEPGPFSIFDRIREALLPNIPEPEIPPKSGFVPGSAAVSCESLETEAKVKPPFSYTFRGALHGIFDCSICFGMWIVFPLMLLPIYMGLVTWVEFPLAGLTSYGVHRFLLGVSGDI